MVLYGIFKRRKLANTRTLLMLQFANGKKIVSPQNLSRCLRLLICGKVIMVSSLTLLYENRRNRSFILDYAGELLSAVEGGRREQATDDCSVYRYFFHYDHQEYWLVRCLLTEITSLTDKDNYVLFTILAGLPSIARATDLRLTHLTALSFCLLPVQFFAPFLIWYRCSINWVLQLCVRMCLR